MTQAIITVATFISVVFFPWPVAVTLALGGALLVPLLPLAAGIFVDTLYYVPHAGALPIFSLFGALVTILAFFVRSRLATGNMGR